MNDKNELNDIILNKNTSASFNKKIVLAVATLGVILIIVVMLMNTLSSNGTNNLPQAVLPPEPKVQSHTPAEESLFEEIEVIEESSSDSDLDLIAQKLKAESLKEDTTSDVPEVKIVEQKSPKKVAVKKTPVKEVKKEDKPTQKVLTGSYYIQVGSFSTYKPNKKFLNSITNLGYDYKYHKIKNLNKVLVGPFKTQKSAKDARRIIRSKVEPGAFLIKL